MARVPATAVKWATSEPYYDTAGSSKGPSRPSIAVAVARDPPKATFVRQH